MEAMIKVLKLIPVEVGDGIVTMSGYRVHEEKWDFRIIPNTNKPNIVADKLLEIAAEYVVKERAPGVFTLSEAEIPGSRIVLGEGLNTKSLTVLVPKPSYLRRVLFIKCNEGSGCQPIYVYRPTSQLLVYEGYIIVNNSDLKYDFIVLECDDYIRVLLPHELNLPRTKDKALRKHVKKRRKKKSRSRGK